MEPIKIINRFSRLLPMLFMALFLAACGSGQLGAPAEEGTETGTGTGGEGGTGDEVITPPVSGTVTPAKPTVNDLSVLTSQDALLTGNCVTHETTTNASTDYLLIEYQPRTGGTKITETTKCIDDAWSENLLKLEEDLYKVTVQAVSDEFGGSEVATGEINVEKATFQMEVSPETITLEAGGLETVNVVVKDQLGVEQTGATSIWFTSGCIQFGQARMQDKSGESPDTFTSTLGAVSANYKADGCVGNDNLTITGEFEGQDISNTVTVNLNILSEPPAEILFVGADPAVIYTKGNNKKQTSKLTFQVIGASGSKVIGETIDFEIKSNNANTAETDLTLSETSAISNEQGIVTVDVQSGYKTDNVTVTAIYSNDPNDPDDDIESPSDNLVVVNGLASAGNFSISVDAYSPLSYSRQSDEQQKVLVKANVNDRYGMPIDNALVTFKVEGTQVSQPGVGAIGKFIAYEGDVQTSFCTTNSDGICYIFWAPNMNNAPDGWVTIMGIVKGEERYDDVNENGYFDEADTFYDEQEPFLDHKSFMRPISLFSGGDLLDAVLVTSDYIEGEFYLEDTNDSGVREEANNKFDGPNCLHANPDDFCGDSGLIDVASSVTFYQSSIDVTACQDFDQQGLAMVFPEQPILLTGLKLCDRRSDGMIPTESEVKFIPSGKMKIDGGDSYDIQGTEILPFYAGIKPTALDEVGGGSITAEVTVRNEDIRTGNDVTTPRASINISVVTPSVYVPKESPVPVFPDSAIGADSFDYTAPYVPSNLAYSEVEFVSGNGYRGKVLFMQEDADLIGQISFPCSPSETVGDTFVTNAKVVVDGRGPYSIDCSTDRFVVSGSVVPANIEEINALSPIDGPGEYTMTTAKYSEIDLVLGIGTEYLGPLSISKILVSNRPSTPTIDSVIAFDSINNQYYVAGGCDSSNTTDVYITLDDADVHKVSCNVNKWKHPVDNNGMNVSAIAFNVKESFRFPHYSMYTNPAPTTVSVNSFNP